MTFRRKGFDVLKGLGLSMRPPVQAPVFLATAVLLLAGLDMPTRAADQLEDSQSAVTAERVPGDLSTDLTQAPDQIGIRMMLVKRLLERQDREGATDTLFGALQHSPANKSVHLLLGDLYE